VKRIAPLTMLLLAACGFDYDETLVGRYRLVAVDEVHQMRLCWSMDRGDCEWIIEDTIFAAGYDDKYVVAARHPNESMKSIVEYYYVIRAPKTESKEDGDNDIKVKGPFDRKQYEVEKRRLHLPEFARIFDDL
jgi:hypothetical protein